MVQGALVNSGVEIKVVNIDARPGEARETLADNTNARDILDWEPNIDFDDGVDDLKFYFFDNLDLLKKGVYNF